MIVCAPNNIPKLNQNKFFADFPKKVFVDFYLVKISFFFFMGLRMLRRNQYCLFFELCDRPGTQQLPGSRRQYFDELIHTTFPNQKE